MVVMQVVARLQVLAGAVRYESGVTISALSSRRASATLLKNTPVSVYALPFPLWTITRSVLSCPPSLLELKGLTQCDGVQWLRNLAILGRLCIVSC